MFQTPSRCAHHIYLHVVKNGTTRSSQHDLDDLDRAKRLIMRKCSATYLWAGVPVVCRFRDRCSSYSVVCREDKNTMTTTTTTPGCTQREAGLLSSLPQQHYSTIGVQYTTRGCSVCQKQEDYRENAGTKTSIVDYADVSSSFSPAT